MLERDLLGDAGRPESAPGPRRAVYPARQRQRHQPAAARSVRVAFSPAVAGELDERGAAPVKRHRRRAGLAVDADAHAHDGCHVREDVSDAVAERHLAGEAAYRLARFEEGLRQPEGPPPREKHVHHAGACEHYERRERGEGEAARSPSRRQRGRHAPGSPCRAVDERVVREEDRRRDENPRVHDERDLESRRARRREQHQVLHDQPQPVGNRLRGDEVDRRGHDDQVRDRDDHPPGVVEVVDREEPRGKDAQRRPHVARQRAPASPEKLARGYGGEDDQRGEPLPLRLGDGDARHYRGDVCPEDLARQGLLLTRHGLPPEPRSRLQRSPRIRPSRPTAARWSGERNSSAPALALRPYVRKRLQHRCGSAAPGLVADATALPVIVRHSHAVPHAATPQPLSPPRG